MLIEEDESAELEKECSVKEFDLALSELSKDKAPGPDVFNVYYIKQLWSKLQDKVLENFNQFWSGGDLPI